MMSRQIREVISPCDNDLEDDSGHGNLGWPFGGRKVVKATQEDFLDLQAWVKTKFQNSSSDINSIFDALLKANISYDRKIPPKKKGRNRGKSQEPPPAARSTPAAPRQSRSGQRGPVPPPPPPYGAARTPRTPRAPRAYSPPADQRRPTREASYRAPSPLPRGMVREYDESSSPPPRRTIYRIKDDPDRQRGRVQSPSPSPPPESAYRRGLRVFSPPAPSRRDGYQPVPSPSLSPTPRRREYP